LLEIVSKVPRFHAARETGETGNREVESDESSGRLADKAELKRRETSASEDPKRAQKPMLVSSICRSSAGHRVDAEDRQRVIFAQKQPTLPAWERKPRNSRQSRGALQENCDF
jgi:hypothetical protein